MLPIAGIHRSTTVESAFQNILPADTGTHTAWLPRLLFFELLVYTCQYSSGGHCHRAKTATFLTHYTPIFSYHQQQATASRGGHEVACTSFESQRWALNVIKPKHPTPPTQHTPTNTLQTPMKPNRSPASGPAASARAYAPFPVAARLSLSMEKLSPSLRSCIVEVKSSKCPLFIGTLSSF
jgi:hypothetical protein